MSESDALRDERRNRTQDIVDKLLVERQEMLTKYCQVAGFEPYAKAPDVDTELLQDFCQVLVDYSAFGHFEIYQRIVDGRERRGKVSEVAAKVYPRIAEASEVAVEFNDKYDASDHALDLGNLHDDLNKLGEELAVRIEMEDKIIAALMDR